MPAIRIGHVRHADVGRKVVPHAQLVADDAAEAGILQRRAGPIAGEHVVRAALVGRFAVAHGADDAELVGHGRRLTPRLGKDLARQLRLDHAERAAILQRRERLGVERFLLRNSAGQRRYARILLAFGRLGARRLWQLGPTSTASRSPRTKPRPPTAPTARKSRRDERGFPKQLHQYIDRSSCAIGLVVRLQTCPATRSVETCKRRDASQGWLGRRNTAGAVLMSGG